MKKALLSIVATIMVLGLWSCGEKEPKWTVKGTINGGADKVLLLEASANGRWYPVDTFNLIDEGGFYMQHPLKSHPDIYRLNLEGKMIYFPYIADETIVVKADASHFDRDYKLVGSPQVETIVYIDSVINSYVDSARVEELLANHDLKKEFLRMAIEDSATMVVGNYLIARIVGDSLLLNPKNRQDFSKIRSITNVAKQYRPEDPRTKFLEAYFYEIYGAYHKPQVATTATTPTDTLFLSESGLPQDIKLYDTAGKAHSLAQISSAGDVTILSFVSYGEAIAPAYNLELRKVYDQYKDRGLQIYQVSTDAHQSTWKIGSQNLPWISVHNSGSDASINLLKYNVNTNTPTTFIINRAGELVERVDDASQLASALKKYI